MPNCSGLTKIVAATVSARLFASSINAMCPAWSAPIVGTSASVPARASARARVNSSLLRTVCTLPEPQLFLAWGGVSMPQGKRSSMRQPHFIVFANEKGGTGKSTTAVHTAIALGATGHRVGALDLDGRQRTMTRYLENRDATMRRLEKELPRVSYEVLEDHSEQGLAAAIERLAEQADVIVIDTPGRDDEIARSAILRADTLVTPMNDSFVDLDLIGQVHPENYKITKPS